MPSTLFLAATTVALWCTLTTLLPCNAARAVEPAAAPSALRQFFTAKLDPSRDGVLTVPEMQEYLRGLEAPCMHDNAVLPPKRRAQELIQHYASKDASNITWSTFHNTFSYLEVSATSAIPQQVHLALTDTPSEMVVMWSAPSHGSVVQWSTNPVLNSSSGVHSATGDWTTYNVSVYTSLPIHKVLVTGLQPRTRYFYRCGDGSVWSPVYNFTSAPEQTTTSSRWAMYGDMGTIIPFGAKVTKEIVQRHTVKPFDLILHVGDLAYAGVNKYGEWEPTWDVWMNQIQPLASAMPYQTGVGNHENYYNYTAFRHRFAMPGPQTGGNGNFWFSFDYGDVHVTSMSTEHDYSTNSPQRAWIAADLAKARARGVQWLILAGHRPYYSSDEAEYGSHRPGAALLHYLEDLIVQFKVDLVYTGHMHCYERTYPTINGTVFASPGQRAYTNPKAPIYVVQGTAGAMILEKWVKPAPKWSAYRLQEYGFGEMEVSWNATTSTSTMHYSFFSNGAAVDEFWIHKTVQ